MSRRQPPTGWERTPYADKDIFFRDVPGIGRYVMKKIQYRPMFRLYLNGRRTEFVGSPEELVVTFNRIIAQREMEASRDRA